MQIVPELEPELYRANYVDLANLSAPQLFAHYHSYGKNEGRLPNRLRSRGDFVATMGSELEVLEIGPFNGPLVKGNNVSYADFLDTAALVNRAQSLGIDYSSVPHIDYVLSERPLKKIGKNFDRVLSSHCVEHQPNLVGHFLEIQDIIRIKNGKYFLLIPDKRYCFDHFISESTIADVLDAHYNNNVVHRLKSVIEHRSLVCHNDAHHHWLNPAAAKPAINYLAVQEAVAEWEESNQLYVDVHAWYFTPQSFEEIILTLRQIGLIDLNVDAIYSTRFGMNEFWVVLGF